MLKKIELNEQFRKALNLMENTSQNVFITGKAGTGKSTLLEYFCSKTKKNVAVLAPTGVAALNVKGQTIHSFFRFKPNITVDAVRKKYCRKGRKGFYKKLDAIIIDEVSMVRADLLDCVDEFLRLNGTSSSLPFGGIPMIFIGDLYQLPPVVAGAQEHRLFQTVYKSPYFFDAHVFDKIGLTMVQLEKIYRQKDENFINVLNSIRNNSITEEQLKILNSRLNPLFEPSVNEMYINLTTTNSQADNINQRQLTKLKSPVFEYQGEIRGQFDRKSLPTGIDLRVKRGSQIMLVNNDKQGRWVNGTIGKITEIEKDIDEEPVIWVELAENKEEVPVIPYTWEMFRFYFNQATGRLDSEVIGSFRQYPLILAWAITIHKSQGKTFNKAIIDIGQGTFAHGQSYVAFSRCANLEGLIIKKPFQKKHILMDWRIVKFLTDYQYQLSEKNLPLEKKIDFIKKAIKGKNKLEIIYLKAQDVKSERVIRPIRIGEMEYVGRRFLGLEAYCYKRKEERVFRIDRILEMAIKSGIR